MGLRPNPTSVDQTQFHLWSRPWPLCTVVHYAVQPCVCCALYQSVRYIVCAFWSWSVYSLGVFYCCLCTVHSLHHDIMIFTLCLCCKMMITRETVKQLDA